jgi:hypothetical protein
MRWLKQLNIYKSRIVEEWLLETGKGMEKGGYRDQITVSNIQLKRRNKYWFSISL